MTEFWKRYRKRLAASPAVKNVLATLIAWMVRFVTWTNPPVKGSHDIADFANRLRPAIAALWHGQHLLGPTVNPPGSRLVAMFSRSADAEINALVAQKLGFEVVRGSGGRGGTQAAEKGGAKALVMLKRALDAGANVAMISDIPHGTPRQAGLGIITLAKISGRPIVPLAIATSRRKVIEKSWDKTTINLPFGRRAVILGEPLYVPAEAGPEALEENRIELTARLNSATREAYALVDGAK